MECVMPSPDAVVAAVQANGDISKLHVSQVGEDRQRGISLNWNHGRIGTEHHDQDGGLQRKACRTADLIRRTSPHLQ